MPRIDYSTGEAALLVEPQSTNLLPYSEDFSQWIKVQGDISIVNQEYVFTGNGTDGLIRVGNISTVIGEMYTCWIEARVSSGTLNTRLGFSNAQGGNIYNETITLSTEYKVFKINHVYTITGGGIFIGGFGTITNGVSFIIKKAQFEKSPSPTSYISTAGVTETRLADEISVPTPAGVTSIIETIDGVEQTPITTIPTTYSLPVGNINKVTMQ